MSHSLDKLTLLGILAALLTALGGCSTVRTYENQFRPVYADYSAGRISEAVEELRGNKLDRRLQSTNRLLWAMEAGKLLHAAHDFEESNRYFRQAEAILDDFENRAEYTLRGGVAELGAAVTNPNALPYRGSYADKIMIQTYKALNYLALGDLQAARVEIRRAYQRQQEALEENAKAIEEAKKEARSRDVASAEILDNSALQSAARIDPATAEAYANFANPFTTFLSGLVYLADHDPARAEVDFRLLASVPIPNAFVKTEFGRIRDYLNRGIALAGPRVYVIFENGLGSLKEEMRVDLILPEIGYTGFAFPKIERQPTSVHALRISGQGLGEPILTQVIANMDEIAATEFRTRMPAMVLRTVTSVIAKEVAAKQLTDELGGIGLLIGSLYKAVLNRADTRTWQTLGKEFHIASFPRPAEGRLTLSLAGRNGIELPLRKEVPLPESDFVLVLVQSVNENDLRVTVQTIR